MEHKKHSTRLSAVLAAMLLLMLLPMHSKAATGQDLELKSTAEVEVTTTDSKGKKTTKLTDAAVAKVIPGQEVLFTIAYKNISKKTLEDVIIDNPVPEHMQYTGNSATGENSDITFSVDNGKSFNVPSKLKIKGKDGVEKEALPQDYKAIRWKIKGKLPPGKGGAVKFRAKLE